MLEPRQSAAGSPSLSIRIDGGAPFSACTPANDGDDPEPVTLGFIRRVLEFWALVVPRDTRWHPDVGDVLPVLVRKARGTGAYYDRHSVTLGARPSTTWESSRDHDVVCHQIGHAIVDALRPQLWNAAAIEVSAFHESAADISAIHASLQDSSTRARLTCWDARSPGIGPAPSRWVARLARSIGPETGDWSTPATPDDPYAGLFYRSPATLPTLTPPGGLSSEPHSLGRVFTAGYISAFGAVLAAGGRRTEAEVLDASVFMGRLLAEAIIATPIVPDYLSQIAAHMIVAARRASPARGAAVASAMIRHGLVSVPAATRLAGDAHPPAGAGRERVAPALPRRYIDGPLYGLSVTRVCLSAAAEIKHFNISGASPFAGDLPASSDGITATSFFEDLIRRGRLDPGQFTSDRARVTHPLSINTHRLILEEDEVVLRRERADCCLDVTADASPSA